MTIKSLLICAFMTLISASVGAKNKVPFPGGKCTLYRVTLTDKKGTPFTLAHPEKYLSGKALQRRAKQHIEVDSTDLPINHLYIAEVQKQGVTTISKSKWNNTLLIRAKADSNIDNIKHLSFVKSVRRVYNVPDSIDTEVCSKIEKDTTILNNENVYGDALTQIKMLNGVQLHEAGYNGSIKNV